MGLPVSVYRDARLGDCTNGGVSSKFDRLVVVNAEGPFDPAADSPAMVLESHVPGCLRLVPVSLKEAGRWVMFGGNYAATSDSRFRELCEQLLCQKLKGQRFYGAVAIHDRVED